MNDSKHTKLTEQLKAVEIEVNDILSDMRSVHHKIKISYEYQEELRERMNFAQKKTQDLQHEYFDLNTKVRNKYQKIKDIVEVFTGNFFSN